MIEIIIGIIIGSVIVWKYLNNKIESLNDEVKRYKFGIKSAYVKFGKSFENFVPFISNFPGNRENTTFLGMPLDFISFDEDSIKFIEVKTGNSQLSPKQRKIKQMIENKQVEFKEVRY
ncbi:MAG: Holliday junction resolvase-like protein [Candidatus Thorarchaeota archaeon]